MLRFLIVWSFLIAGTTLEASGDALVRIGLFERVVGLYVATLFLVWQAVSFFSFRSVPSLPIMIGGTLIVAGGLLVTFWSPASES